MSVLRRFFSVWDLECIFSYCVFLVLEVLHQTLFYAGAYKETEFGPKDPQANGRDR